MFAAVSVNSKKLYQVEALIARTIISRTVTTYKLKVEITRPDLDPIVLGGDIIEIRRKTTTFKLVFTGALENPISFECKLCIL